MIAKTMEFFRDREVMIFLSGPTSPTIPEWNEYTAEVARLAKPSGPLRGMLVVSEGGSPDAKQRGEAVKAYGDHAVPIAMCSASTMERGIITAMSWIYPAKIASFAFDAVPRGLVHLGITGTRAWGLREQIRAAQRKHGWRVVTGE
jgi:hypothetical protein